MKDPNGAAGADGGALPSGDQARGTAPPFEAGSTATADGRPSRSRRHGVEYSVERAVTMQPPDVAAVNRAALRRLEALCARWLPGGRRIGAEWTCGSLRGEPGRSCKVNLRSGRWADFATGEKGGDVVSLAAAVHRLPRAAAAERLARMLGLEARR
jgi:putative DNA primase/helicase